MSPSLQAAHNRDTHTTSRSVRTATAVAEEGVWSAREHTSEEPMPMPEADDALATLDDEDDEITVPTGTAPLIDNVWRIDARDLLDLAPPPTLPDRAPAEPTPTESWSPRETLRNTLRALGVIE